jgi:hypothetical protein
MRRSAEVDLSDSLVLDSLRNRTELHGPSFELEWNKCETISRVFEDVLTVYGLAQVDNPPRKHRR